MSLVELLSATEKTMIKKYIENYVASYGEEYTPMKVSVDYVLREWDKQKHKLYELLGHNFTISKEVEFDADTDELMTRISKFCFSVANDDEVGQKSYEFWNNWFEKFVWWDYSVDRDPSIKLNRNRLSSLMDERMLVDNVYTGDSFEIINPQRPGRPIKVPHGCKVTKVIGKIAEAYDIPNYEEFRIRHSQALNQKKLKGTLCLSIHPLNYMTMSDNDCDWSSCMSWKEKGCYRQGTVEMMNSPMVVVAYLTAKDQMDLLGDDEYDWDNKKWRELFVVTDEIITEVKSYPYFNKYLTQEVLKWLKELYDKNLSYEGTEWTDEIHHFNVRRSNDSYAEDHRIYVDPRTNLMYNDFESVYDSMAFFNKAVEHKTLRFNYSGKSECMICGEIDRFNWNSEGDLVDLKCNNFEPCSCCGDITSRNDLTEIDGEMYCPWCLENRFSNDAITGERVLNDRMVRIYIKPNAKHYKELEEGIYYTYFMRVSNDVLLDALDGAYREVFPEIYNYKRPGYFFSSNFYYIKEEDLTSELMNRLNPDEEYNDNDSSRTRFIEDMCHSRYDKVDYI